jgi:Cdc6-like AAA superfamily ATPase
MRLLELDGAGQLSLTKGLLGDDIPKYAILSHTWGADTEEVTFQDLTNHTGENKSGYEKIYFCGRQADRDGLRYFWVDTCCIDKTNSNELAEAINSMFRWYNNATKCYVYLSDVSTSGHDLADASLQSWQPAFRNSRWFTRGWTLQELIAPRTVEFFCSNGKRLGDRKSLEGLVHEITRIAVPALRGTDLSVFTVAERMSWATSRKTTKEEDKVYSLLGLFDVTMPLVYGEREDRARDRLLEQVRQYGNKRHRDELPQASFERTKRLKTSADQFPSIPSSPDVGILGPVQSVDATKHSLVEKLYFDKIDERLTGLTAAQQGTCRWFLTKPEYISWQDVCQQADHSGFLWIRGNPGTGKSTLMKFLFEKAKSNARGISSQITLSFFFLARGTIEEKSITGLYRSLLHQLFQKAVELKESLDWMTTDGAMLIQKNGWHEEALKQTLIHAVQKLGSQSVTIFVDALDECNKEQAHGMVFFFEELCNCAKEAQVRLQICFSSRHYPYLDTEKSIKVILEDEIGHTKDIEQYIKSKLRLGKTKQAEPLRSEILEKSSSIFLWVVLVLDILNSEYTDSFISIKKIRERLKDIPPKLADLFEMILTRDGENLERLQVCLKWILFATRPLKPQELYFAIQLDLDKECSGCWDQDDVELDRIKTFVRNSSKGLAEVTRNKASEVQFIHESIRDFLLGKYEGQWSGASGNFVGHSHEILRNCCLTQLNSISQGIDIPDPLPRASETAQLRDTISLKFPFLEYSVSNILCHANSAQENTIEQGDFLANFPLQQWILLNNTLIRHNIRRYTKSVSLIYIFAEKNLANLIRVHPRRAFCFDVENERYGAPILAALVTGSYKAIQAFIEVQAEIQSQELQIHRLCKQYSENRNKATNISRNFTFSQERRSVCSYFAEHGDEVILTFFCALGRLDAKSKDRCGRTPLSWVAQNGHEAVVKLLLATERVDADSKDNGGWTPLSWAARGGREAVVKLLLATERVDADSKDNGGRTPLSWAARDGHEAVVKLLLATERVDADSKDNDGRTPLSGAAWDGHEAVVKLLLATERVDADSKDNDGWTPLSWAA